MGSPAHTWPLTHLLRRASRRSVPPQLPKAREGPGSRQRLPRDIHPEQPRSHRQGATLPHGQVATERPWASPANRASCPQPGPLALSTCSTPIPQRLGQPCDLPPTTTTCAQDARLPPPCPRPQPRASILPGPPRFSAQGPPAMVGPSLGPPMEALHKVGLLAAGSPALLSPPRLTFGVHNQTVSVSPLSQKHAASPAAQS